MNNIRRWEWRRFSNFKKGQLRLTIQKKPASIKLTGFSSISNALECLYCGDDLAAVLDSLLVCGEHLPSTLGQ